MFLLPVPDQQAISCKCSSGVGVGVGAVVKVGVGVGVAITVDVISCFGACVHPALITAARIAINTIILFNLNLTLSDYLLLLW